MLVPRLCLQRVAESLLLLWFTPWEAVTHLNSTQTKIIGHAQQQKPKTSNSGILYVKTQTVSACWHMKYSHVSSGYLHHLNSGDNTSSAHPPLCYLTHFCWLNIHQWHCQWTHPHNKLLVYCCLIESIPRLIFENNLLSTCSVNIQTWNTHLESALCTCHHIHLCSRLCGCASFALWSANPFLLFP